MAEITKLTPNTPQLDNLAEVCRENEFLTARNELQPASVDVLKLPGPAQNSTATRFQLYQDCAKVSDLIAGKDEVFTGEDLKPLTEKIKHNVSGPTYSAETQVEVESELRRLKILRPDESLLEFSIHAEEELKRPGVGRINHSNAITLRAPIVHSTGVMRSPEDALGEIVVSLDRSPPVISTNRK